MAQTVFELPRGTDAPDGAPPGRPPQVFKRVVSAPAGLPWVQARVADLEARHGAPVAIQDLLYRLRRLEPWSLGRPGRFVAAYVRAADVSGPFETDVEIEGRAVRVAFGTVRRTYPGLARWGVGVAIAAVSLVILAGGVHLALRARGTTETQLQAAERTAGMRLDAAQRLRAQRRLQRALRTEVGPARPAETVLTDLAWATAAKTSDARIVAVHWDHGLLAVEAKGDAMPLADGARTIERSERPVRSGVWLWGVRPSGAGPAEAR